MKILVLIGLLLTGYWCKGQNNCQDYEFYEISLLPIVENQNKPTVVKFDFDLNPFLKETVDNANLFDKREKGIIIKTLSTKVEENIKCESLKLKLAEIGVFNNDDFLNEYTLVRYSRPVHLSDDKVILFVDVTYGGSKGGGSVVQVFEREGNHWHRTKNIGLAMY